MWHEGLFFKFCGMKHLIEQCQQIFTRVSLSFWLFVGVGFWPPKDKACDQNFREIKVQQRLNQTNVLASLELDEQSISLNIVHMHKKTSTTKVTWITICEQGCHARAEMLILQTLLWWAYFSCLFILQEIVILRKRETRQIANSSEVDFNVEQHMLLPSAKCLHIRF